MAQIAQIVWTAEARRWLQEIYDYIAERNEDAAYRTVTGIHQRVEVLLQFPEIGYRYNERPSVRVLLYGHYRIAYQIAPTGDIQILGVFHDAMDVRRYLMPPR